MKTSENNKMIQTINPIFIDEGMISPFPMWFSLSSGKVSSVWFFYGYKKTDQKMI